MFRISNSGTMVGAIAATRVRELLIRAQQPLIEWLGRSGCRLIVAMVRGLSGERKAVDLFLWLAESENIQAVFRHGRAFTADNTIETEEPVLDISWDDCERVRDVLLRSVNQVIGWIEDERNAAQLLSVLCEIGETVDMGVVVQRLERDTGSGHQLAQRAFQSIRLLMPGGRPNSGIGGLAGLAARSSLM